MRGIFQAHAATEKWYNTRIMDIVILLGAPGSGKGTIAGRLAAESENLKHVSSGDLLRGAVAKGTAAGVEAKAFMDKGALVPDEIIADRIAGRRTCPKCKAGYHVKALPPKVEGICDKCGAELVVRKDDNPDTVKDRLVVYHRETEPLIAFYEKKGLLRRIDGDQGPDRNAAAFRAAM